jgi:uncharacterized membrane protein
MDMAFIDYLTRFGHVLFGITWIGLLYYFNFVQTEYFKEAEASARVDAFSKLAPRALLWFRWAALATFVSGVILLGYRHSGLTADITVGALMGTLMFLNVWLIIWPNQKIIVESNQGVQAGNEPQQPRRLRWRLAPTPCSLCQCSTSWAPVRTTRAAV